MAHPRFTKLERQKARARTVENTAMIMVVAFGLCLVATFINIVIISPSVFPIWAAAVRFGFPGAITLCCIIKCMYLMETARDFMRQRAPSDRAAGLYHTLYNAPLEFAFLFFVAFGFLLFTTSPTTFIAHEEARLYCGLNPLVCCFSYLGGGTSYPG